MQNENFYITLLSNSSKQYYDSNTTTQFTTQLLQRYELEGDWMVALVEFMYPATFYNVSVGNNKIIMQFSHGGEEIFTIPEGVYSTNELISEINKMPIIKHRFQLSIVNKTKVKRTAVKLDYKNTNDITEEMIEENPQLANIKDALELTSLIFSPSISMQLGFEVNTDFMEEDTMIAKRPALPEMGLPFQVFVYTDIISNQTVGDTSVQLLRNIHVDRKNYLFGNQKVVTFDTPHYLEVTKKQFQSIEIHLRDETGAILPFEFGTSCCKLHFKRIQ